MDESIRLVNALDKNTNISPDLISFELSGCEATQFAMAATNQNSVDHTAHVKADSEYSDVPCDMAKTGHHGKLSLN